MSQFLHSTLSLGFLVRRVSRAIFLLCVLGVLFGSDWVSAGINEDLWKMKYGVTTAQMADSNWLAADDDKDGIKNGDEIAAGTNPFNGSKTIKVASVAKNGANVVLTFPTEVGKRYRAEATPTLGGSWVLQPAPGNGTAVVGDGNTMSLTVPYLANNFYRIRVDDADTDNDGIGDWAEKIAGYNPNDGTTDGTAGDLASLTSALASFNSTPVVTVTVVKPNATQPPAGQAAVDSGSLKVTRTGVLKLGTLAAAPIIVPLQISGTASEGTDYVALPDVADFTASVAGQVVSEVIIPITPKSNTSRKTNMTAIVKALPGGTGAYTIGSASSGAVVINPSVVANGTGLTGRYHNQSNTTYGPVAGSNNDQVSDIFGSAVEKTVNGEAINFTSGANGWGSVAGPSGMTAVSSPAYAFSVRWTGQILPQYSETYTIAFRSNDGGKVWIDGKLLIDRWGAQNGAQEYVNKIALKGGVLYDIVIEYMNNAANDPAEASLSWWSLSQTKQVVPVTRLFPEPTQANKVTPIVSSLSAVGYVGVPFSFSVASPNISGSTTYTLAANSGPLPPATAPGPNLVLSSAGLITGTPTTPGTYNVAINATNPAALPAGTPTGSSVIEITIFPVGSVTREILATTGPKVSQITLPPDNPRPPNDTTLTTLDDDTNRGENVGVRLRGYLVPPKTGNYYFYLSASSAAEFWLSTDSLYANKVRHASTAGTTTKKTWNSTASQQTPWLYLIAGKSYYYEVLQNTGATVVADDHVAIGWCQDDVGTIPAVAGAPNGTGAVTVIPNGGNALQGYPLSGTVPGYIFQPYDYPVLTPPSGTLYACNLGPQANALTTASGSSNLQVNPAETQAVLHFSYQNLGSPKTAYHLHVDSFVDSGGVTHPQGEIIFDIDDADAFPPELRPNGGYVWEFAPTGSFTTVAQIREAIKKNKVYLNVHSVLYPNGEIRGTFGVIDGSQTAPLPYPEPTSTDVASTDAGAARFLNQATFGASPADIAFVKTNGFAAWVTDQLAKPNSRTSNDVVAGLSANINEPYPPELFTNAWWKNSITGPDQLRQRLAFALSEIMVVSWANRTGPLATNGRALADYYDQLVDYCLPTAGLTGSGNFREVLEVVTLTPAMGLYLDMRANLKGNESTGLHPNENYAREIMQLFSIGIFRMWDDGKFVLGADAGLIPTYSQEEILGLSALFTGWNYAQAKSGNRLGTNTNPGQDNLNPMTLIPTQHDLGAKLLLNNVVTPAATGQTPRVAIASIPLGASGSSTVNTVSEHGLKTGDTVRISGATAQPTGTINASFTVTVTSPTAFTVPVECTTAQATSAGTVTGATVRQPTYTVSTVIPPVAGSQAENNATNIANHPYDQYGLNELEKAMDNIFLNDNTPPYICRQLIQRFVTSDPSPGYVYRVVQKFKDNGSGVRGDLAAVVRQILLDGEARRGAETQNSTTFGKQREPMLRLTGPSRAFPAPSYTGTYTQLTGAKSNRLRVVTSSPNDFSTGFPVSLNFRGNYTAPPAGQTSNPYNNPTSTTYTVQGSTAITSTSTQITGIATGSPCVITTALPHGLVTGNGATISGVVGGTFLFLDTTFEDPINRSYQVTRINDTQFSVPRNCTVAPTDITNAVMFSNPCKLTTATPHGMATGDTVTIQNVVGGNYNPTINGSFQVKVVDANSFTVPVICLAGATNFTNAQIVGGTLMEVPCTGMIVATYNQPAGSTTMTVSASGPQTNVNVPGPNTLIKSKVYLDMLTMAKVATISSVTVGSPTTITTALDHGLTTGQTVTISGITNGSFNPGINATFPVTVTGLNTFTVASASSGTPTVALTAAATTAVAELPTGSVAGNPDDRVYEVDSNSVNPNTFSVTTTDTPSLGRTGSVLIPRIDTSYTPSGANNVVTGTVTFNTNVNHNLQVGNKIWVDVPAVGTPVTDAEYAVSSITDEDHFLTLRTPNPALGGTYPNPAGANNNVVIWPLHPPPHGSPPRSGVVTVNQSSFNLNSTENTLTQSPLNAPTVFNYFFPDYKFPGELANNGLDAPEFQLTTDTNVTNLTNSLTNMFIGTGGGNSNPNGLSSFPNGGGAVVMSIESYVNESPTRTSNAKIPELIDDLANLLVGGPLLPQTKNAIIACVANDSNFPYTTPTNLEKRDRIRAIIHLIITSAEYAVQK